MATNRIAPALPGTTRIVALAALTAWLASAPAPAADWSWSLTPYAWATDVHADVSIDDRQVADTEIDFSDLLDKVDTTAQIDLEGRHGRHGFALDLFRVELSEDERGFTLPAPLAGQGLASAELELTILEAGGLFNPRGDGTGFSLLYGGRLFDRDTTVDARFPVAPGVTIARSYEVGDTLIDALVGTRYVGRIDRHWSYDLRADVSAGGTDLTWDAFAGVTYAFGPSGRYAVVAGYRYLDVDFQKDDDGPKVDADVTLSGFLAGLRLSF